MDDLCPGPRHEPEGAEYYCQEHASLPEAYDTWEDCCTACRADAEWWRELLAQVAREGPVVRA